MKKKQSKLKMDNLEAIESLPMQELTPEEADKIVGGKGGVILRFCPYPPTHPDQPPNH